MDDAPRCYALVPCAGVGLRAGTGAPKQYALLGGRAVVAHTLAALAAVPRLAATLVVLAPDDAAFEACVPQFEGPRGWVARCGGATRADNGGAGAWPNCASAARATATGCWCTMPRAACCAASGSTGSSMPAWPTRSAACSRCRWPTP